LPNWVEMKDERFEKTKRNE